MITARGSSSEAWLAEIDLLLGGGGALPAAGAPAPPDPAPIAATEAPAAFNHKAAPARILVIDDNKDYRDVVHYVLQSQGYEVDISEDGEEGLAKTLHSRPDLIILDFNMPRKNGFEVLREIRSNDEIRKIPVVLFTGAPNRKQLKELGMDVSCFLEKPVTNAQLLRTVAAALGRNGLRGAPSPDPAPDAASPELPGAAGPQPAPDEEPTLPARAAAAGFAESDRAGIPPPLTMGEGPAEAAFAAAPAEERETPAPEPPPRRGEMPELSELENRDLEDTEGLLVDIVRDSGESAEESRGLEMLANDSPLVNRVNEILVRAVALGASDIHIEPQEKRLAVRIRLDGALSELCALPSSLGTRVAARIKIMSDLVITERRLPQDGQFRAAINGVKTEFRVSTMPSSYGEKIVMRILGGAKIKGGLAELGFSERDARCVERALRTPHGLILVTGPTGSGKTTTLYTMLATINKPHVNVMTAEDPVEYRLPGITQVHAKPAIGLTFEAILRSFLRQDPDIMLVGEIRDLETAEIAVKASITGHLVLSTLHTNSAPATIARLTHMGLPPFLVAASVKLIIAQRLVRTLCEHCKAEAPPSESDLRLLTEEEGACLRRTCRGAGCKRCHQTGFAGRRPLMEVMPVRSPQMRGCALSDAGIDRILQQAQEEGMVPLRRAALAAVAEGVTSLDEALQIVLSE